MKTSLTNWDRTAWARSTLMLLLVIASATAQNWVQVSASSPSGRNTDSAYNVYNGTTTIFGGYGGPSILSDETWEWDGVDWTQRVTVTRPAARAGHSMAFDSNRNRVMLFGGRAGALRFGDTWEWDGLGWAQQVVAAAPPPRSNASMTYDDSRNVVVLFGGMDSTGALLDDTWEWNGVQWIQRLPANKPSPRMRASMTWDNVRNEAVLFGGGDGNSVFAETWTYELTAAGGVTWTLHAPNSSPPARWDADMVFDGNCGAAILYGGAADTSWVQNLADAWQWDGSDWQVVVGATPPARHGHVMSFDAQRGETLIWGGRDAVTPPTGGFLTDSWIRAVLCTRSMTLLDPVVVGQPFSVRYDYPPSATLNFCLTLLTGHQPSAFSVPIPGMPSIGLARVDIFNILMQPAALLDGSGSLTQTFSVPYNQSAFSGAQWDIQSVDIELSTLTLRWADNDLEVTVAPAPPIAGLTASAITGVAPLNVTFQSTSTLATSYLWDFGDGMTSTAENPPPVVYPTPGSRTVTLTVTGPGGVDTTSIGVDVLAPNLSLGLAPIPSGTYQMGSVAGSPDEQPVHAVTISEPFWAGIHEVTQDQYQAVMGSNPSAFVGLDHPVEQVSRADAVAYCQALTTIEGAAGRLPVGYVYRLPTEAEWEYMCRAGTTSEWSTGPTLTTGAANFAGSLGSGANLAGETAAIGSYPANAFGLYDLHGNVAEWCLDTLAMYPSGPVIDPYVSGGAFGIIRGGNYSIFSAAFDCRSAERTGNFLTGYSASTVGFRFALAPSVP